MMDSLVPLPIEDWPKLRDIFRKHWPFGVVGSNLIDTQIQFQKMGLDCPFRVYCPYGDIQSGMVAKIQKKLVHQVIIMATSEDTSKLEGAVLNTSLIDWSKGKIDIPYIPPGSTRKLLHTIHPILGLKLAVEGKASMYLIDRNSELYQDVVCPSGTYVAPLGLEHVTQVDRAWAHRYPSSDWLFSLLIQANQSYGLFSEDHALLTWIFISEAGFLSHLYCEEPHRRKGYARFMVKHVSNDQLGKGKDVYCCALEGNWRSMDLFSKLGYEKIGTSGWMNFEKE